MSFLVYPRSFPVPSLNTLGSFVYIDIFIHHKMIAEKKIQSKQYELCSCRQKNKQKTDGLEHLTYADRLCRRGAWVKKLSVIKKLWSMRNSMHAVIASGMHIVSGIESRRSLALMHDAWEITSDCWRKLNVCVCTIPSDHLIGCTWGTHWFIDWIFPAAEWESSRASSSDNYQQSKLHSLW